MKYVLSLVTLVIIPSVALADSGQLMLASPTASSLLSSLPAEILTRGHYQVVVSEVLLRTAPRANAQIQLKLKKGDRLNLMGVQDNVWAKVKLESGRIGYVYASSIQSLSALNDQQKEQNHQRQRQSIRQQAQLQARVREFQSSSVIASSMSSSIQTVAPALTGDIYTVSGPKLNVRMDARPTSFLIKILHKDEKVSVIQWFKNGWARIRLLDGSEGYVFGQFLAK